MLPNKDFGASILAWFDNLQALRFIYCERSSVKDMFLATVIGLIVSLWIPAERSSAQSEASPATGLFTWQPEWAVSRHRPGYPLLEGVSHFSVQPPSVKVGAYHHHPQIKFFGDHCYACWSAHRSGEDGPGQRVLFSHSLNGTRWSPPVELFPAHDLEKDSFEQGRALTALGFRAVDGKLFAIAAAHQNTGFTTVDQMMTSAPLSLSKSDQFPKRSRKGLGRLIRAVTPASDSETSVSFGPIYWLNTDPPEPLHGFESYPVANLPELDELKRQLTAPLSAPTWDFKNDTTEIRATDGVLLTEPTVYQTTGGYVRLWRAQSECFRMYGQIGIDGQRWTPPQITPIPDAPAKTVTVRLASGETLLIGNQVFNQRGTRRDPLTVAISKNGFDFDRAFAIRWRTPKFRTPPQQAFPDGRGTGFQYPSIEIAGDRLWVIYSVNKEAVDVSCVPLKTLLDFVPCGFFSKQCIASVVAKSPDQFKGVVFGQDAILKGITSDKLNDGSMHLKMVWRLKKGRRPIRFIHLCDPDGNVLRQGDRNAALFDSVTDNRTVLDSIRISPQELKSVSIIAVGFYDPVRKSAPIISADGKTIYKLPLVDLIQPN